MGSIPDYEELNRQYQYTYFYMDKDAPTKNSRTILYEKDCYEKAARWRDGDVFIYFVTGTP